MNMDYKKVANRLVNVLMKQNAIIQKLAQAQTGDPAAQTANGDQEVKNYLDGALTASIANSGVGSNYRTTLSKTPGQNLGGGVKAEESYTFTAIFTPPLADNASKQKVMNNFYAYIKANRPDLDGRVSFIFG
jgi:hypothetical protein